MKNIFKKMILLIGLVSSFAVSLKPADNAEQVILNAVSAFARNKRDKAEDLIRDVQKADPDKVVQSIVKFVDSTTVRQAAKAAVGFANEHSADEVAEMARDVAARVQGADANVVVRRVINGIRSKGFVALVKNFINLANKYGVEATTEVFEGVAEAKTSDDMKLAIMKVANLADAYQLKRSVDSATKQLSFDAIFKP